MPVWFEHIMENLHKEPVEGSTEICGYLDTVTGATCTRTEHLDKEHADDTDWGCIIKWKEPADIAVL
jgi:hypothetical protein